ncbi:MAG TPA: oligosaccharide flippase family protein, partial [Pyrinomonadaceae bacterium]|nr:oligosaccharide flippase family protein [Pyrinomonadaceae bacterium]
MSNLSPPEPDAARLDEVPTGPPAVGMTTRVVRGSLWALGGGGVTLAASVVSTPFVIRLLGAEAYGALALVNVVIGYMAFADVGMGMASTRFGAGAHARGRGETDGDEGEAAVVWTALWLAALTSAVAVVIVFFAAAPLVERVFRLPASLQHPAVVSLRLAAAGFFLRSLAGVLNTPQLVRLRLDLSAYINAGVALAQSLLVPAVLFLGGGLVGAVAVMAGAAATTALANALVGARLLPRLRARPRFDPLLARQLARFGAPVVLSTVAALVLTHAEKLFLTRFASVKALAHYSVAYTLASLLLLVPTALNQTLLPAFSQLQGEQARE